MNLKHHLIIERIDYDHNFKKAVAADLERLQNEGCDIVDVKPFAGPHHVGAFVMYREKAKPSRKASRKDDK